MNVEEIFKPHSRVLAACSGGPDSVALLYLLKEAEKKLELVITVGHVNHGLRGKESDADEKFVGNLAREFKWKFLRRRISLKSKNGGNLEELARVGRYEKLIEMAEESASSCVVTAHNLDDQAETILMNIFRGSGFRGLGGMPFSRIWPGTRVQICRPLLNFSKDEILGYLANKGGDFRTDRMNQNPKFLRHWLRMKLIPQIEARFPGFRRRLGTFADIVRGEETFWNEKVREMTAAHLLRKKGGYFLDWDKFSLYSLPMQRRFLKQVIGPDLLSFENLENLREWMGSPPSNGRVWQLRKGWFVERMSKSKGSPSARIFRIGQDGIEKTGVRNR